MHLLRRVLGITTYIIFMLMGFSFFIGFFLLGTYVGVWGQDALVNIVNFLDNLFNSNIGGKLFDPNIIPDWATWVIASPAYALSLFGLVITILTQKTTSSKRKIRKEKEKEK